MTQKRKPFARKVVPRFKLNVRVIDDWLRRNGLNPTNWAAQIGMSSGTISRLRNRKVRPSADNLAKLAAGMGVRPDDLKLNGGTQ